MVAHGWIHGVICTADICMYKYNIFDRQEHTVSPLLYKKATQEPNSQLQICGISTTKINCIVLLYCLPIHMYTWPISQFKHSLGGPTRSSCLLANQRAESCFNPSDAQSCASLLYTWILLQTVLIPVLITEKFDIHFACHYGICTPAKY